MMGNQRFRVYRSAAAAVFPNTLPGLPDYPFLPSRKVQFTLQLPSSIFSVNLCYTGYIFVLLNEFTVKFKCLSAFLKLNGTTSCLTS